MDEGVCSRSRGLCQARRSFPVGTGSGASLVDGVIPTPAFPGDETLVQDLRGFEWPQGVSGKPPSPAPPSGLARPWGTRGLGRYFVAAVSRLCSGQELREHHLL